MPCSAFSSVHNHVRLYTPKGHEPHLESHHKNSNHTKERSEYPKPLSLLLQCVCPKSKTANIPHDMLRQIQMHVPW
eukprot:1155957-Pelagomonas_calceolata.AAC.7